MLRAIREIQPRWVVGENVLGLVNWSGGLVFHEVQTDLEAQGYEVQTYVLAAASVGAPHRRDRIFFVAHANGGATGTPREGRSVKSNWSGDNVQQSERREQTEQHNRSSSFSWDAADTKCFRLDKCEDTAKVGATQAKVVGQGNKFTNAIKANGKAANAADTQRKRYEWLHEAGDKIDVNGESAKIRGGFTGHDKKNHWANFPTQSPICVRDDGISDRLDSITFPKWRNESIKAAGNAIVPQVVFQIFKAIEQYEQLNTTTT